MCTNCINKVQLSRPEFSLNGLPLILSNSTPFDPKVHPPEESVDLMRCGNDSRISKKIHS
jgi:hypothetical protein